MQFNDRFEISEWSPRAAEISGYSKDEVMGKEAYWFNFAGDEDRLKVKESISALIKGEKIRDTFEIEIADKQGEPLFVRIHSSALRDDEGRLISILTLIEDLTDQQQAQKKLRRSEELFKKLFTHAPQAIVMVDANQHVQRVNNSFETLFGYSQKELLGSDVNDMIVPDGEDRQTKAVELEQDHIFIDRKRYTKNGEQRDVIIGSIPVYLDEEIIAGFGIYIDVTERKKSEERLKKSLEEKQVLLEEVHHRVKNNLAIVSGLLQMQTMHVDDDRLKRYIQNSQLRIRSMAIVHEMLYKSHTLTALNMKSYMNELANVISNTLGPNEKQVKTKVKSDKIELNINQAIPCALAVSELITNAYEYAFEGRPKGTVRVQLSQLDDDVTVLVKDDGVGLPGNFEEMRKKSLGLSLIENLCNQLETDLQINSNDSGTQFKFTFKKAEVSGASSSNLI